MTFTEQELSAILKLAFAMVKADGKIAEEEVKLITNELLRFGVIDSQKLLKQKDTLTQLDACSIISRMANEEKKYVTAYLGTIMCIDGEIQKSELTMWTLISTLCNLPKMSIQEAVDTMLNLQLH